VPNGHRVLTVGVERVAAAEVTARQVDTLSSPQLSGREADGVRVQVVIGVKLEVIDDNLAEG
jgi:hypothetical protein